MRNCSYLIFVIFVIFVIVVITDGLSSSLANSQTTDSCSANLNLNGLLPFDTASLNCVPVWAPHNFILRHVQTSSNIWSFILSAPDENSYIAIGFSPNGAMVGSSAIVGWVSPDDGTGMTRQYFLGGTTPNQVVPNEGDLNVVTNSSRTISQSSRLYLAFQLNVNQPTPRLLYSLGPTGVLPVAPTYRLTQHRDMVSTLFNYVTGQTELESPHARLRKSHGILNILGWGILMLIGVIVGRYCKHWDPIWFYSHVLIQSLGFLLGFIGVICGLVLRDLLKVEVSTHKSLGILILVLGCLQAMAVFIRPNKTSKWRKYWNWYHHNIGRILIIFAIANVFYGIHLGEKGTGWNAGYGVIIAILILIAIFLEIRMRMRK